MKDSNFPNPATVLCLEDRADNAPSLTNQPYHRSSTVRRTYVLARTLSGGSSALEEVPNTQRHRSNNKTDINDK